MAPTADQNLDTQIEALEKIDCDQIFQDKITGMSTTRLALNELQSKLGTGDTVVVARFFDLGRSGDHLIKLVSNFNHLGVYFKVLDLGLSVDETVDLTSISIYLLLA